MRIPGFMWKFVYAEYWKSIIRLVLCKENNLMTFTDGQSLYLNIDKNTFKKVKAFDLLEAEPSIWSVQKRNLFNFCAVYSPFILRHFVSRFTKVYFATDMSLANYNTLCLLDETCQKICIQHGYFPIENNRDIDGLNADLYLVRSDAQKHVVLDAGYQGDFDILKSHERVFQPETPANSVVIVGPGFSHNRSAEELVFELAKDIVQTSGRPVFFRPHPRCSEHLLERIKNANISIDNSLKTSVYAEEKVVFIGFKSTMLLDAQEIGHSVILVEHSEIPKYFPKGEIEISSTIENASSTVNAL